MVESGRRVLVGGFVLSSILVLGCARPAVMTPDPYEFVAESAFRIRDRSAPCEVEPVEWGDVFGDVRLHPRTVVVDGVSVGDLAARYGEHHASQRFHDLGKTTLEQLRPLTTEELDRAWSDALGMRRSGVMDRLMGKDPGPGPVDNPVASYLLYHATALRLAAEARRAEPADTSWTLALAFETAALTYLLDSMSSDRMNVGSARGPFFRFSRNRDVASSYFGDTGLFVLDSDGEVWQAFGRRHLEWYRSHLCQVMEAAQRAVRELYFVFHVANGHGLPGHLRELVDGDHANRSAEEMVKAWTTSRAGPAWLEEERLPSLRALPTPVWATWRRKIGEPDENGVRPAVHFPQVRADSLHDPTLVADRSPFGDPGGRWRRFLTPAHLPEADAVPSWRLPQALLGGTEAAPMTRLREDRDLASVRFIQRRSVRPSLTGLFLTGSLSKRIGAGGNAFSNEVGAGWLQRSFLAVWFWYGGTASYLFSGDGQEALSAAGMLSISTQAARPSSWLELGSVVSVEQPVRGEMMARVVWLPASVQGPLYSETTLRLHGEVRHGDETQVRLGAGLVLH